MRLFLIAMLSVFLLGCCGLHFGPETPSAPYNITLSESLNPSLRVYAVDKNANHVARIADDVWFYPVERGLPEGTVYAFRLLDPKGGVAVPVNENFTAEAPGREKTSEIGVQQYHGFPPGNYTIELVVLQNGHGTIVAKANITVFSPSMEAAESARELKLNCSAFLPKDNYSKRDEPGAQALQDCAARLAAARSDLGICKALDPYYSNGEGLWVSDSCISNLADLTGNVDYCSELYRLTDRGNCHARLLNDTGECTRMVCDSSCIYFSLDDQIDLCLQGYAITKRDASVCPMIKREDYRTQCVEIINRMK
ncbi:MAG: hypothetical protein WC488_01280 [Candidatus Micrarchaeia archaeon]